LYSTANRCFVEEFILVKLDNTGEEQY
jgi:hypothetical protein